MKRIHLVSCVAGKRAEPTAAQDLYTSAWFRKARSFVEQQGGPWFILSAKHGLVEPERRIGPYEQTLNRMGAVARRAWARTVLDDLLPRLAAQAEVVFLAGQKYREHLVGALEDAGFQVRVPMEGLAIGQQLSWLSRNGR